MIKRVQLERIQARIGTRKAILLLGPRQTGKTTLLRQLMLDHDKVAWYDADEPDVRAMFENPSSTRFKALLGENRLVVVDEAQRIPDIGLALKLITDQLPHIQVIATGSSAFDLASQIKEALTGRKWEYQLFPLSFAELVDHHGLLEEKRLLPHRLVYGTYPEVVVQAGKEKEVLKQLTDSFLYKDLLMMGDLKKPEKLVSLLKALAFQVGSEVSYNELARTLRLDNETVEKYISLLEQAFVLFRVGAFSRNLRKELSRGRKIYFYDNGIRNALIAQFGPLELRSDKGALWENYLMAERMKHNHYTDRWAHGYFWRTQDQQEIDYLEEMDGLLYAWEFKWSDKEKVRFSKTFTQAYPNHVLGHVHQGNVEDFLLPA